MRMAELLRYEIPPEIVAFWTEKESDVLLPLQETAIKRFDLFGSGNLLIQAPTSSGKTFIGEMAAIQTALRRQKVVYLVPLKALAEEKYRSFREKYTSYGLKIIISTRDRREFDQDLEAGDFSIAVVVYEKLAQLLVRRPERLEQIAMVVADELEILSDPERGASAEILLTRILQTNARLIGLSAVIGRADKLAEWMNAEVLFYERRPVELRFGVLYEGEFRYKTYNERTEGCEALLNPHAESAWEILTANLRAFVERGEPCVVFVKAKHESRRGAELLAQRVSLPAARRTIERLRRIEATRSRDCLIETLGNGVAFHNADLSPEERGIVEDGFREGEVRALVSTSTLAMGMNLPVQNVFLSSDKWRYDNRLGLPWKTPILRAEYENMAGRAGRYGAGQSFGRAILIATTPFDFETLWRRYVDGECEPVDPRLAHDPLEDHVLRLAASRCCRTQEEMHAFLESTLTGKWIWQESLTLEETGFRVRAAIDRAADAGALDIDPRGAIEATPLGAAVAGKGATIATARDLEHWIAESETRVWTELDLLFAAASTADGRMFQFGLTTAEYEQGEYPAKIKRRTQNEPLHGDVPLNRIRNCSLKPFFEEVRAIKIALVLRDWIEQVSLCELEENFKTMAGQILAAADQIGWIVDTTAAIATARGCQAEFIERIRTLAERIQRGVRAETLPLAWAAGPETSRAMLIALASRGLHVPEALAAAPAAMLAECVPSALVRHLKEWAKRVAKGRPAVAAPASAPVPAAACPAEPGAGRPVLVVDDRRPAEILVDGHRVKLQDKQYRLIRLLAERPGECVSYETIYQAIWGETMVENNQMHFQKRKLVAAIKKQAPDRAKVIKTVNKRGFVLNLVPEEVLLYRAGVSSAA